MVERLAATSLIANRRFGPV